MGYAGAGLIGTGIGAVAGAALIASGADVAASGAYSLISGEDHTSGTAHLFNETFGRSDVQHFLNESEALTANATATTPGPLRVAPAAGYLSIRVLNCVIKIAGRANPVNRVRNHPLTRAMDEMMVNPLNGLSRSDDVEPHLFRGTSDGFSGGSAANRGNGTTFTSTDPVVATVFAQQNANAGRNAVLHMVPESKLKDLAREPFMNTTTEIIEKEIRLGIKPTAFAKRATTIPVERAKEILKGFGIHIPKNVNTNNISEILKNIDNLTEEQTKQFLKKAGL